ncbi:MAG: hypothetical protein ACRDI2_06395, partial [Chloroflexota bacterium]
GRGILVRAFQRTVLTLDPRNPPPRQTERANVGTDYARAFPAPVGVWDGKTVRVRPHEERAMSVPCSSCSPCSSRRSAPPADTEVT